MAKIVNKFAYIVTSHNSGQLLNDVIYGIKKNQAYPGEIIVVLDGCTDCSEEIVDHWGVTKLFAPDVHEIKSINVGLKYIQDNSPAHYIITVQDDVILQDPDQEDLCIRFFTEYPYLAHLVFRLGANYTPDFQLTHLCENHCGYGFGTTLAHHEWAVRMVGCKSPSCIPRWFIDKYGFLDEGLCPRGYDDIELSLRALSLGFKTIVLATQFQSELAWGGTRKTNQPIAQQDARNAEIVKKQYADLLKNFKLEKEYSEIYGINQL